VEYIQLISAAGMGGIVGSLLTTVVQAWLQNKQYLADRRFQEKKEAYIGLLEAYKTASLQGFDNKKEFAYWSVRCELVAPAEIVNLIEAMKTSDYAIQAKAFSKLKTALRKDLGIHITD